MILSIGLSVMYMIIMSGNPFSEKVAHERTEDVIELEAEKRKLELYYLNLQLNPHFLFNTLNVIYVQSRKEKARTTSEMIMTLSELLRYQLYEGADEKVMLKSEIKHIENYIELQKMRQTDLCIDYQKDGAVEGIMVYPFVTISLLENAFKYVDVNNSGEKFVKIFIGVDEKYVSFVVQNTKCEDAVASESTKPKSSGIGIENTKKRLDLLYAGKYMLDVDAIFGTGLSRSVTGDCAKVIEAINKTHGKTISIDIPSGLFADDNSRNDGAIVKADLTLSIQEKTQYAQ